MAVSINISSATIENKGRSYVYSNTATIHYEASADWANKKTDDEAPAAGAGAGENNASVT